MHSWFPDWHMVNLIAVHTLVTGRHVQRTCNKRPQLLQAGAVCIAGSSRLRPIPERVLDYLRIPEGRAHSCQQ
jgi:hypothetical protein